MLFPLRYPPHDRPPPVPRRRPRPTTYAITPPEPRGSLTIGLEEVSDLTLRFMVRAAVPVGNA